MKTNNLKKVISVTLAACVILSVFAGCKKDNDTANSNGKMTVTWMGAPYYPNNKEGNYSEKLLEEKFNIDIKPIYLDSEAYKTKKPLMMASGEIPDLIYEMDPIDVQGDVKQGFLTEIPYDTIKKYAPTVFENLNTALPEVWLYSYCDEKNYGIPNLFYAGDTPIIGVWRTDWLKNVGIDKVPETIDEMHDALYKFANNDPDGNGKKDTYGMSGDMSSHYITFAEIFGAYGALPFNWVEKDGKAVYGGLQPEVKEALKTLSAWYKEGILDPDFITDDVVKNIKQKFQNGQIGYVNHFGHNSAAFDTEEPDSMISIMKQLTPEAEIAPAKPLKGPEGKDGLFVWGKGGHIVSMGSQVEKQPEKMRKILEMCEYMFANQDFLMQVQGGKEGTHYKKNSKKGGIEYIPPYNDAKKREQEFGGGIGGTSFFGIMPALPETLEKVRSNREQKHYEYMQTFNVMTDAFLKPDVVPDSDKYFKTLKDKQVILMSEIIRGEKSVDAYDEFAEIWNRNGGDRLDKNAAKISEVKKTIMSKVGAK